MRRFRRPWWVAGGWAIDAFLGHQSRTHADIDVGVLRRDQLALQSYLGDWDLHAASGVLWRWPLGEPLAPDVGDVWARPAPESPWTVQFMLNDAEGDTWQYRRDRRVSRPIEGLTRMVDGVPYLAPEVQLLFKSTGTRPKDAADAAAALPLLDADARAWLLQALRVAHPGHPWERRLTGVG
ncbi:MAG: amino acid transporter [Dehalococcoidia bacterium]|nr:amino acid transporter [Dehalococcoidia bacterium]